METNHLKNVVMRRVYALFILRELTKPAFLRLYALLLSLGIATLYVSFGTVYSNIPFSGTFKELITFYEVAFLRTEIITKCLVLISLFVILFILRDLVLTLQSFLTRSRLRLG